MLSSPAPVSADPAAAGLAESSGQLNAAESSTTLTQASYRSVQDKVSGRINTKKTASDSSASGSSSSSSSVQGFTYYSSRGSTCYASGSILGAVLADVTSEEDRSSSGSRSSSGRAGPGSTCDVDVHSVQADIDRVRSVLELYKAASEGGIDPIEVAKHEGTFATVFRLELAKMQTAGIRGPCSSQCPCADYASTMRQLVSACSKAVSTAGASVDNRSIVQDCIYRGLPAMDAQLLDPAAGHRLEAVQQALHVFRE